MSVPLKRKPLVVEGAWLLTDHDGKTAMEWVLAAMVELAPLGWRVTPIAGAGGAIERVECNNDQRPLGAVQAALGQWLVLDGDDLEALSEADCATIYDPTES